MTTQGPEARLTQLGIELPRAVAPAANYVPARKSGSLIYIAGQVPTAGGKDQYVGKVGQDVSIEDAQKAARLCAINILAQLRTALGGSLDGVAGCADKLGAIALWKEIRSDMCNARHAAAACPHPRAGFRV